eukprot:CAMPEP_0182823692 /NCGR_PEP_ID=MMETSP0006_2-20121128/14889_1 /TAXON_ID=97485 /ORGANISM="Prymnesium parvum, Strain Texoma1" /LENGTH=120 /DNA_ID=CAMNT_0024950633 /DNA_START=328 /DNA_END=690 /DNA_ORIENTATION=-
MNVEVHTKSRRATGLAVVLPCHALGDVMLNLSAQRDHPYLCASIASCKACVFAPLTESTCFLFFQKWNEGSARTPWLRISLSASGLLSPITFRKDTSLYVSESSSNLGAMILHGPHHEVE